MGEPPREHPTEARKNQLLFGAECECQGRQHHRAEGEEGGTFRGASYLWRVVYSSRTPLQVGRSVTLLFRFIVCMTQERLHVEMLEDTCLRSCERPCLQAALSGGFREPGGGGPGL